MSTRKAVAAIAAIELDDLLTHIRQRRGLTFMHRSDQALDYFETLNHSGVSNIDTAGRERLLALRHTPAIDPKARARVHQLVAGQPSSAVVALQLAELEQPFLPEPDDFPPVDSIATNSEAIDLVFAMQDVAMRINRAQRGWTPVPSEVAEEDGVAAAV